MEEAQRITLATWQKERAYRYSFSHTSAICKALGIGYYCRLFLALPATPNTLLHQGQFTEKQLRLCCRELYRVGLITTEMSPIRYTDTIGLTQRGTVFHELLSQQREQIHARLLAQFTAYTQERRERDGEEL